MMATWLPWSVGLLLVGATTMMSGHHAVAGESAPAPLVFAGSGSSLPITRLLAEAFRQRRPELTIEVPASIGSTGGIRAVADGATALGLISRPLKASEQALGLTVVPYARTAVVIGAHPTVADEGITFDDLIQIYKGTKTRWSDGREIIVLTREPGDSSIEVLERTVPGFKEVFAESQQAKRWMTLFKDQEMNQTLATKPYALGLSDLGAITAEQLPIKALTLNGVPPTPDHVRSGRYSLVKTLSFVFIPDKLPKEAWAFLDFVRLPEAAQLLVAHGYLPGD
jgi:phosphate transport system substrate-binding protein